MNGRGYDYNLGRFLSVDPFIQDPGNSQNMNPYVYILNNPLSGTDPTGYQAEDKEVENVQYKQKTQARPNTGTNIKVKETVVITTFTDGTSVRTTITPGDNGASFEATGFNAKGVGVGAATGAVDRTDSIGAQAGTTATIETLSSPDLPSVEVAEPSNELSDDGNGGTEDQNGFLEFLLTPWGGADGFVTAVQCIWQCGLPGDGSLDASLAQFGPIAFPISGSARITAAASSRISSVRGVSVLGHYPAYIQLGEAVPSRVFSIPAWVWKNMTPTQQWAANSRFLDRIIARGDEIYLATNAAQARAGSIFARELEYLVARGYSVVDDGWRLVPPGPK